ncbi:MAG: translation elongation factor-like protein [Candidatus Omnitrophota bacterium]
MAEEKLGVVEHYFGHIFVAAIKLEKDLKVGDTIHIKGHTTDFTQPIESIQIEHNIVDKAGKGDDVGIKVKEHVRVHDLVYKVTD